MRTGFLRARLLIATLLVVSATLAAPPSASAAPVTNAKIEARKREAAAVQQKLDSLAGELEVRSEDLAQIEAQLMRTRAAIAKGERELANARADLADSKATLASRASTIYRTGSADPLAMLVGVTTFRDLFARLELMRRVGEADARTVEAVEDAKQRIETAQAALEARAAEQVVLRKRAEDKRSEVQSALAAQKRYLSSLNSDITRLIQEERERQARIAEEQARRAAAALAARQRALQPSGARLEPGVLGGSHGGVVVAAMRFLGVPYVWGGSTPAGFDCSGLTQYCYAQVGVSIPRTARDQYFAAPRIPAGRLDLLQPGDLVFFAYDHDPQQIHHVGIYAGNGTYIHAPQTGDVVRVASLSERISSRGDYVGASRP